MKSLVVLAEGLRGVPADEADLEARKSAAMRGMLRLGYRAEWDVSDAVAMLIGLTYEHREVFVSLTQYAMSREVESILLALEVARQAPSDMFEVSTRADNPMLVKAFQTRLVELLVSRESLYRMYRAIQLLGCDVSKTEQSQTALDVGIRMILPKLGIIKSERSVLAAGLPDPMSPVHWWWTESVE